MRTIRCPNCGVELDVTVSICPKCGKPVPASAQMRVINVFGLIGLVLALVNLILPIFYPSIFGASANVIELSVGIIASALCVLGIVLRKKYWGFGFAVIGLLIAIGSIVGVCISWYTEQQFIRNELTYMGLA